MLRTTLLALSLSTTFAAPYKEVADNEITWMYGWEDQSCDTVCESQQKFCWENEWPTSEQEFSAIVSESGAWCDSLTPGDSTTNPQTSPTTCYWEDSQIGPRCGGTPSSGHRRFCPCSSSKPTPDKADWNLGSLGQRCDKMCESQSMWCTEAEWPTSHMEFETMIKGIPNSGCTSVDGGWSDMETNPEKEDGQCWWAADAGMGRCALEPDSDHQRFCPCTKSQPPPPPPVWKVGWAGQSCNTVCSSQSLWCEEGMWPSTQSGFDTVLQKVGVSCQSDGPGWDDMEANPEMDGDGNCWWSSDATKRCGAIPPDDHQRFCPCSTSPPPPTWVLGWAGQNCSKVCYSQAMRCTEKAWPTSQSNFQQEVLNTIPNNGGCNTIQSERDDMESDPQKQGDTCWWDADPADRYRCNEIPSSDHQRFCPCVGITPPPPPPAHCPPAEAACAADQNCNAFGVFNNNYQLHGCSDALLANGDWYVYVLSNTSGWQPIAGHVNVDESQCKVHPTGKITGTCSTAAPPPPPPPTPPPPPANCQQVLFKHCGGTHKQCIKCATHTHAKETAAAHCSPLDMQTFCTRCNGHAC